jgi:hypothetical protein
VGEKEFKQNNIREAGSQYVEENVHSRQKVNQSAERMDRWRSDNAFFQGIIGYLFANALTPEIIHCFDAAAMPYFSGCRPHYRRTFGLRLLLIEPFLLSFRAGERIRVAALARFWVAGLAKS